jgi:transcriptional regulator with XRE-family HTH domain
MRIAKVKTVRRIEFQHGETGAAARKVRKRKKVALRSMAKKMGISAAYLSDLERGRRNWNVDLVNRFERGLGS